MQSELAAASSNTFNKDGLRHDHQYRRLKHGSAPIRDVDGRVTGAVAENTKVSGHCTAAKPCVRLQGLELVDSPQGKLAYMWGIGGNRSGHVLLSDLADAPDIDTSWRAGNGKPCQPLKGQDGKPKSYFVSPRAIEGTLRYKGQTYDDVFSFKWYGTPGSDAGLPDYTYLSWSWINKEGGGVVRALVSVGDLFYPCNVERITSHALANAQCKKYGVHCDSGWVKAMNGKVYNGERSVYGWLVHSHRFESDQVVYHVLPANP